MQVTTTTPLFAATLRPDRSLRAAGGWIGLSIAGLVGAPFLVAIPEFVLPGLLAYGLAIGAMSVFSLRLARRDRLAQTITLWPDQLEVVTLGPRQERQLRRLDPAQARLRLVRNDNERTTGIFLRQGTEEIEIGTFLSIEDKSSFARAFGAALRKARRAA